MAEPSFRFEPARDTFMLSIERLPRIHMHGLQ
jgi:hypothetical protein